jgi:hypothetical protein
MAGRGFACTRVLGRHAEPEFRGGLGSLRRAQGEHGWPDSDRLRIDEEPGKAAGSLVRRVR